MTARKRKLYQQGGCLHKCEKKANTGRLPAQAFVLQDQAGDHAIAAMFFLSGCCTRPCWVQGQVLESEKASRSPGQP